MAHLQNAIASQILAKNASVHPYAVERQLLLMQVKSRAEATAESRRNDDSPDDALAPDAKLAYLTVPDSIVREALRLKEMGVQMKSGEMRLSGEEVFVIDSFRGYRR